ncbi:MAG: hypothetical protein ABEN55_10865 [Bradymonadaceae bacterium]
MKALLKQADSPTTYADPGEGPDNIKTQLSSNGDISVPEHPSKSGSETSLGSSKSDGIQGSVGDKKKGLLDHPIRSININVGGQDSARKQTSSSKRSSTWMEAADQASDPKNSRSS